MTYPKENNTQPSPDILVWAAEQRAPAQLDVELRVLGPLEVHRAGVPVKGLGRAERVLLCRLALAGDTLVPRPRLLDELWGGSSPNGAAPTLRVYLSRLRRAVGSEVLVSDGRGCGLSLSVDALDISRFEARAGKARRLLATGEPEAARRHANEALGLWRGPAMPEIAEHPFALGHVARLEEERLAVLEVRIEADLACGLHQEVVGELAQLTLSHPFREELWAQRMRALYRCRRQGDALRVYQDLRRVLRESLGVDPSPELQQLELAILRQAPSLRWPQVRRGVLTHGVRLGSTLCSAHAAEIVGAVPRRAG